MAVKANGAKLDWFAYWFGVEYWKDGIRVTERCEDLAEAEALAGTFGGNVKLRAVYVTDWFDASHA